MWQNLKTYQNSINISQQMKSLKNQAFPKIRKQYRITGNIFQNAFSRKEKSIHKSTALKEKLSNQLLENATMCKSKTKLRNHLKG